VAVSRESRLVLLSSPSLVTKGTYFVSGIELYYIKDITSDDGEPMFLVENCFSGNEKWMKADPVFDMVEEVITQECEIMPVS
jgi:hypothetical protein